MKTSFVGISTFLDTRRALKNKKYPVKLSISFQDYKKRYGTGFHMTLEEWELLNRPNLKDENLKSTRQKLSSVIIKAERIAEDLNQFSFCEFERIFFGVNSKDREENLSLLFLDYIEMLEDNGRIGTADSYKCTLNSLLSFRIPLKTNDITKDFLKAYEKYMLDKNSSPSTIGIYLRQLRRIINVAITNGFYQADKYPFRGFVIPSSRNVKKALSANQIKALPEYKTENNETRRALDFWLFSYMSNGMNMTDICYLKLQNLQGDFFFYFRVKTKNTRKKDLRPIKVPLLARSTEIIEKWKNRNPLSTYLFPILEPGLTAKQEKFRIKAFIKRINKIMKEVAADLGISSGVGTYVARHSYSTILKRNGAPIDLIRENLGHSSILTTQNYLDDFTDDSKIKYANILVTF